MRWLCVLAAAACARASPAGPLADRVVASKSLDEVKMMLTELEVDYAAYTSDIALRKLALSHWDRWQKLHPEDVPTTPAVSSDNPAKDMGAVGAMLMPMLDTNKDGKLDKEEVKAIMKGMADEVTQNFMAGLDTDGDGLIDKEEGKKFVDVLQSVTGGLLLNQGGRKKDEL